MRSLSLSAKPVLHCWVFFSSCDQSLLTWLLLWCKYIASFCALRWIKPKHFLQTLEWPYSHLCKIDTYILTLHIIRAHRGETILYTKWAADLIWHSWSCNGKLTTAPTPPPPPHFPQLWKKSIGRSRSTPRLCRTAMTAPHSTCQAEGSLGSAVAQATCPRRQCRFCGAGCMSTASTPTRQSRKNSVCRVRPTSLCCRWGTDFYLFISVFSTSTLYWKWKWHLWFTLFLLSGVFLK